MTYKPSQPLRINRPARADHGKLCCFVALGPDPAFAWVAFNKKKPGEPIAAEQLRRQADYPRKLYPLSHLEAYESQS
jgi:hypothetical protein